MRCSKGRVAWRNAEIKDESEDERGENDRKKARDAGKSEDEQSEEHSSE